MYYKVYFILAHKNPVQINELVSMLRDGKSLFFIHLDHKVNVVDYQFIGSIKECFFIKKRVRSRWGGFGLVQAALNGMKEIQEFMNVNYQNDKYHCILLSGEDLPLKTNEKIHFFLEKQQDISFLNHWKLPYEKWWKGGLFRFESLYIFDFNKYPKTNYWLNKVIRKLKFYFLFPINRIKKQYPDLELYGSSQWMILSKDLMEFLIDASNKNPKLKNIFKYVLGPDELFFPTLLYHFQNDRVFKIENKATHLIIFEGTNANPKYLSIEDVQKHNTEITLFARKFDKAINNETITYIQSILKQ